MNIYVSDKEQIEMIKNWWRENGTFTILSMIIVLILSGLWHYWQRSNEQDAANASMVYEQILNHESNQKLNEVEYDVTSLMTNHPKTPYASLGAFISAQNAINANNLEAASEKFDWVISHSKSADFKQIAKIRKARVLVALKKYDEGLNLLKDVNSKIYMPLISEIRGDIYVAKGDKQAAMAAYQNALNSIRNDAPNRQFLQMKYDQVNS